MRKLMDKLKIEDEKLNLELEESHGDPNKMKIALERKINLYKRFLKESDLGDLDRLSLLVMSIITILLARPQKQFGGKLANCL